MPLANQLRFKSAFRFKTGAVNIKFSLISLLSVDIQTFKFVFAF